MADSSKFSNVLKAKEDMQKSAEQLEAEKREILSQRIPKIGLEGLYKQDLIAVANQFHDILVKVYTHVYELNEKHERQKYDMMELAERARQIEKGKAKTRKSNIVHTGLGGSVFTKTNEEFPQAPGKISLFSRYERVTDRRTFKDRRELWAAPKKSEEVVIEKPKAKIKNVDVAPEKPEVQRRKAKKSESEEPAHKEEAPEPVEAEPEPEAAVEEEAPAAEEAPAEEAAPAEEEAPADEE